METAKINIFPGKSLRLTPASAPEIRILIVPLLGHVAGSLPTAFRPYIIYRNANKALFILAAIPLPSQRTSAFSFRAPIGS